MYGQSKTLLTERLIMNKPLIIIAGPTACGKTSVSVKLAKLINGEIISADSMQVYKYMDIGTAKILPEETEGIPHYMIDELYPDEEFSVAVFQQKAKKYIEKIYAKGKIPILVGGTGFYINALIYNNDFSEEQDTKERVELQRIYNEKGKDYIFNMLKTVDPESAEKIHPNNIKKVIRALEFYKQTGKKISQHNIEEKQREAFYDVSFFVLNMDRNLLYNRINQRIDIMLKNGLLNEVSSLLEKYSPELVSMQGLGYKEFIPYFNNQCSLDDAIEILKRDTRHFAKRQLTWFKHQCHGTWINVDQFENSQKTAEYINKIILEKKHEC